MRNEHQLSGSFTVTVNVDRVADLVARRVTDKIADWLDRGRAMDHPANCGCNVQDLPEHPYSDPETVHAAEQAARGRVLAAAQAWRDADRTGDPLPSTMHELAAAVDALDQPDVDAQPQPEQAIAKFPEGWTPQAVNAFMIGCTSACVEGHTYAGLCQAAMPIDPREIPQPDQNVTPCQHGNYACELCDRSEPAGRFLVASDGVPYGPFPQPEPEPTGTPVYDRTVGQIPDPRVAGDDDHEVEGHQLGQPRQPFWPDDQTDVILPADPPPLPQRQPGQQLADVAPTGVAVVYPPCPHRPNTNSAYYTPCDLCYAPDGGNLPEAAR